jgi:hypothetical protein
MDEAAFIAWLEKIESIKEMYGEVRDIVLLFDDSGASDADFHELIALYRRYNIDRRGLKALVNKNNEDWVRDWDEEIFLVE